MATSTFQPLLSSPSGSGGYPSGAIAPLNISGTVNTLNSMFTNRAANRKQAIKNQVSADQAGVSSDLIDLHQQREIGNLESERVGNDLRALRGDDTPDAEQAVEFGKINERLKQLEAFKTQGLGNDTVFRIRKNSLYKEALTNNPLLGDSLNTLFNGEISDQDTSSMSQGKKDVSPEITSELTKRHGEGNWGIEEYERLQKQSAQVANFNFNKTLGTIKASDAMNNYGHNIDLAAKGWAETVLTQAGASNTLTPENMLEAERSLDIISQTARKDLQDMITADQANGTFYDPAQLKAMYGAIDDKIKIYSDMLEGKDFAENLKTFIEVSNNIVDNNKPWLLKQTAAWQAAGFNPKTLFDIVKDSTTKSVVAAISAPWINDLNATPDDVIAMGINFLMGLDTGGRSFQDPTLQAMQKRIDEVGGVASQFPGIKKVAEVVATTGIKQSADFPEEGKLKWVEFLSNNTTAKDGVPALSGDIIDGAQLLIDEDFSANLMEDLPAAGRARLKNSTRSWVSNATGHLSSFSKQLAEVGREFLEYDFEAEQFVISLAGKEANVPGLGNVAPDVPNPVKGWVDLINHMLTLADNPHMDGVVPTKQEILKSVNNKLVIPLGGESSDLELGEKSIIDEDAEIGTLLSKGTVSR